MPPSFSGESAVQLGRTNRNRGSNGKTGRGVLNRATSYGFAVVSIDRAIENVEGDFDEPAPAEAW